MGGTRGNVPFTSASRQRRVNMVRIFNCRYATHSLFPKVPWASPTAKLLNEVPITRSRSNKNFLLQFDRGGEQDVIFEVNMPEQVFFEVFEAGIQSRVARTGTVGQGVV